jgi:hypothetical protein
VLDARVGAAGDAAPANGGGDASSAVSEPPPGDAGDELAQALDRRGVRADNRRVNLVVEASCRHEVECGFRDDANRCIDEFVASSTFVLLSDPDCVDAHLDQLACYTLLPCDHMMDACVEGLVAAFEACAGDLNIAPETEAP